MTKRLINENSILKKLPELTQKELLIFDSMRFGFEMIDYAFEKLIETLTKITNNNPNKNVPGTFGYAWSIIDNAVKISNICKQLPWENESELVGHLFYLKDYRNTFQHLEDRIDKSLIQTESPIFGVISWVHKLPKSGELDLYQLISGNLIQGPNSKQTVPDLKDSNEEINTILLHTVNNKAELIETNLNEVMKNLEILVNKLESRLNTHCIVNNLSARDWKMRQDITLHITSEKEKG